MPFYSYPYGDEVFVIDENTNFIKVNTGSECVNSEVRNYIYDPSVRLDLSLFANKDMAECFYILWNDNPVYQGSYMDPILYTMYIKKYRHKSLNDVIGFIKNVLFSCDFQKWHDYKTFLEKSKIEKTKNK